LNKVEEGEGLGEVECSPTWAWVIDLPETFFNYETTPREYFLNAVTAVLDVQTRVSDLYNQPHDQIQEQLRLLIEKVKEGRKASSSITPITAFSPTPRLRSASPRAAALRPRTTSTH
jgi:hypothetical protein